MSVTHAKASELWRQCQEIAEASGLQGLRFWRAPRSITSSSGRVDVLSADRTAGHASGFDDAICDELGLLPERARDLVNGLRSSVSARGGRFIALSIVGDSPFTREMVERRDDAATSVHLYQADEDAALDDEEQWLKANPGLGTIKSMEYMRDASRRALATPADQASFRAFDLNVPQSPSREMIVSTSDWQACVVKEEEDLPLRAGEVCVGFDLGGASSMTAAVAVWPRTGRVESWGAFGDVPELGERSKADGQGALYLRMQLRGELSLYSGRVTPVSVFLQDVAWRLAGEKVVAIGADRFRRSEAEDALASAGVRWPQVWRGMGAGGVADGSADVLAFQRMVLGQKLKVKESLLLASAIADSTVQRDPKGNLSLDKARHNGRIDALSALVIACGLAERVLAHPKPVLRYAVAG